MRSKHIAGGRTARWLERLPEALIDAARAHLGVLAMAAVFCLMQAAALLILPAHAGRLTAAFVEPLRVSSSAPGRGLLLGGAFLLVAVYGCAGAVSRYLVGRVEIRIAQSLRTVLHARLHALPLGWFEHQPTGRLLGWLTGDVEAVARATATLPATVGPSVLAAIAAFVLLLRLDPGSALGAALVVPLGGIATRRLVRPLRGLAWEAAEAHAEVVGTVREQLDARVTIRLFDRQEQEGARHRSAEERLARARDAHLRRQVWIGPLSRLSVAGGLLGLVLLRNAHLGPAELVPLLLYVAALARPLASLAALQAGFVEARVALDRLAPAWRADPERRSARTLPRNVRGVLAWREVEFAYPGRAPALRGVDLRVEPGEIVALVGANGAGKTTLCRLLLQLVEPDRGCISIDGTDLRCFDPRSVRRAVGMVTQRTRLLDRSIAENIAYGRPQASPREIEVAAEQAGVHDFIASLPNGYETRVGEDGVQLSGGQRQRIALARVLLKDPAVLVLDEATSMLDVEGERRFLTGQSAWLRRRAVLLVTHRPASIALADRVVRLEDGKAVEIESASRARRGPGVRALRRTPPSPRPGP